MFLALDIGKKRIGVALSDQVGLIATPYCTYERTGGKAERAILKLLHEKKIQALIVGLPLGEQNQKTPECIQVENFCRRLSKRFPVKIEYVDEYASSKEALELIMKKPKLKKLSQQNLKRKGVIDALSATILLQGFLDNRN